MPHRSAQATLSDPHLSSREWHAVQAALRQVDGVECTGSPLKRVGQRLRRFVPVLRHRSDSAGKSDMVPLAEFLCEGARHGPAVDILAERLQHQGFTPAQIAALRLIAG